MRLAYFSPLPPTPSGISDYSHELLPHLAKVADVTVYADDPDAVVNALTEQFEIRPLANYPAERWQYDLPLYQMGNSTYHEALYQMMCRYPGVVVLHDYGLHHFISHRTAGQGDVAGYGRELAYALGEDGIRAYWQLRYGERPSYLDSLPLNDRLLDLSLGVITHSRYVHDLIAPRRPHLPQAIIPQLMSPSAGRSRRAELDWPPEAIIFAMLGQITPTKQPEQILTSFAQLRTALPNARLLFVGENRVGESLTALIEQLQLTAVVKQTGHVATLAEFADWVHTADVVINLRYPTVGETSAAALRGLAAGRPLIVYDHGWYSEIPAEAAYKIPPNDEAALLTAMTQLTGSADLRQKMGAAGLEYVRTHCQPEQIAQQYAAFLAQIIAPYKPHKAGGA